MRPWYKKKRYIGGMVLGVIILIAVVASSGGDGGPGVQAPAGEQGPGLFAGRVDAQPQDQERNHGEPATIDGVSGTVTTGGFQQSISEFESTGYVVIQVALTNQADEAKPYNIFDWRIQTPGGQVKDISIATPEGQLGSGDIVQGGSVSGSAVFEVGNEKGDFYILWKPNAFMADRGVWKVTVS